MQRHTIINTITQTTEWDIVIIGGGATGLGIAVDAASRGLKTLLLEAYDFAKGTSSKATKLVHGGVRYLAQGNISLVYEALHERGRLQKNAPHLVRVMPHVVPAYNLIDLPFYGSGLLLYSILAGRLGFGFSRIISRHEALTLAPTLSQKHLKGGIVYYDGQFDDARLAITLMRTAFNHGATLINHMPVTGFVHQDNKIVGVHAQDRETGVTHSIRAKSFINATGVFVDDVRKLDKADVKPLLARSQGIHIVVDRSFLPGDHAVMIPKTDDGRVLFALPWHDCVVIGTTDTPVPQADIEPRALDDEIEFVLSHTEKYLTRRPQPQEVLSVFAGLRPLVKAGSNTGNTKALSRDHTIVFAESGLMTITGGKWTTYRHMAEDAVNQISQHAQLGSRPCVTHQLRLHGYSTERDTDNMQMYGSDAPAIRALMQENPAWANQIHADLPYTGAEVVWAVRQELARTVEDVLARRTRSILLNAPASIAAAPYVAHLIATELQHDNQWIAEQVTAYTTFAQTYLLHPANI
ncbi:MAG: FAD-dependent oxidoreductase [Roseiflexaceae bacterium]